LASSCALSLEEDNIDRYSSADKLDKYSASIEELELDKYSSTCEEPETNHRVRGHASRDQVIATRGGYNRQVGALGRALRGDNNLGDQQSWDDSYSIPLSNDKSSLQSPTEESLMNTNVTSYTSKNVSGRMFVTRSVARSVGTDLCSADNTSTSSLGESEMTDLDSDGDSASSVSRSTETSSSLGSNSIVESLSESTTSFSSQLNQNSFPLFKARRSEFDRRLDPSTELEDEFPNRNTLAFPANHWPEGGIVGARPCPDSIVDIVWNPGFFCKCGPRPSFEEDDREKFF
jgi:hypothetical protein